MSSFGGDRQGNVALMFAILAPLLFGIMGGSVDYARLLYRRSELQAAVDAGVLAGGNMLKLAGIDSDSVKGATEQSVRNASKSSSPQSLNVRVDILSGNSGVFARAEEEVPLTFGGLFGIRSSRVAAEAQANVVGRMRLCMLTLDGGAPGAFHLKYDAKVTATNCTLYSNSTHGQGMLGELNAQAYGETICTAGGFSSARATFVPNPQTGCPVIGDPLRGRVAIKDNGECKYLPYPYGRYASGQVRTRNTIGGSNEVTLEPGVYCNGLLVHDHATVKLKPGIYIFRNGPLTVIGHATFGGENVGLYFNGSKGGVLFDVNTTISLAAPTSGPMAGILMSEDPQLSGAVDPAAALGSQSSGPVSLTPPPLGASQPMRTYRIISNNARTMLGTIYLPAGRLVIDAERAVADQSAYTVVVAQQVNLYKGPNLVLNAHYDKTSVPVPPGVGPRGGKIVLTK